MRNRTCNRWQLCNRCMARKYECVTARVTVGICVTVVCTTCVVCHEGTCTKAAPFRTQKPISTPWSLGLLNYVNFFNLSFLGHITRKIRLFVLFSPFCNYGSTGTFVRIRGFRTFFPTKGYPFVLLVHDERGTNTPLSYPFHRGFRTSFVLIWLCRALV